MLKKNNKGMTLVEIVIVLLIASIAMTITGGILVNSLGYFNESAQTSLDKQTADGVLDFINGEIKYATYVTVTHQVNTTPDSTDGWHCLYVTNHVESINGTNTVTDSMVLYKDGSEVFTSDYYSKRNLDLQVRGFTSNEHRLDMKVILNDKQNKQLYKTTNTYELINLNMDADDEKTLNFFKNISTVYKSLSYDGNDENTSNVVLWYIKDTSYHSSGDNGNDDPVIPTPTPVVGGNTVGDQIECINYKNIGGIYQGEDNHAYPPGVFYYYQNYWWQNCSTYYQNGKPGDHNNRHWKKIDYYFDFNSYYEKGDILLNKTTKEQYVWLVDYPNDDNAFKDRNGNIIDIGESTGDSWWDGRQKELIKKVSELTEKEKNDVLKPHDCSNKWSSYREDTVAKYLNTIDLDEVPLYNVVGSNPSMVKLYQNGKDVTSANNKFYYQYYLKIFKGDGSAPGTSAASGWTLLDISFHENSSYKAGDIVYLGRNSLGYIRAKRDVDTAVDPVTDAQGQKLYWERVE